MFSILNHIQQIYHQERYRHEEKNYGNTKKFRLHSVIGSHSFVVSYDKNGISLHIYYGYYHGLNYLHAFKKERNQIFYVH